MKIEHRGVDITDVPYFDSITVTPGGVELIAVSYDNEVRRTLTIAALTELRDVLSAALEHAASLRRGADQEPDPEPSTVKEPRTWKIGDFEPAGVTGVEDKDGDHWVRLAGGRWRETVSLAVMPWPELLTEWGPVTEATYSRATS